MFRTLKLTKASSIVEYMTVVLFLLAALFLFQNYIVRAFSGRWRAVGDTFGSGRQYDPKSYGQGGTLECFYHEGSATWVATSSYESWLRSLMGFGDPASMMMCCGNFS